MSNSLNYHSLEFIKLTLHWETLACDAVCDRDSIEESLDFPMNIRFKTVCFTILEEGLDKTCSCPPSHHPFNKLAGLRVLRVSKLKSDTKV